MRDFLARMTFAMGIVASSAAFAGDKTVTLAVNNMDCAACPSIVKGSLEAVPGVAKVSNRTELRPPFASNNDPPLTEP